MKDCLYNPSRMYNCPIIECKIKINDIENMLYHLEKGHACNFVDKNGPNVLSGTFHLDFGCHSVWQFQKISWLGISKIFMLLF